VYANLTEGTGKVLAALTDEDLNQSINPGHPGGG
jgi:hypothetical protein